MENMIRVKYYSLNLWYQISDLFLVKIHKYENFISLLIDVGFATRYGFVGPKPQVHHTKQVM